MRTVVFAPWSILLRLTTSLFGFISLKVVLPTWWPQRRWSNFQIMATQHESIEDCNCYHQKKNEASEKYVYTLWNDKY